MSRQSKDPETSARRGASHALRAFIQARLHHPRCIDALAVKVHRRFVQDESVHRGVSAVRQLMKLSAQVLRESNLAMDDARRCSGGGSRCALIPHRFEPVLLANALKLLPRTHQLAISRSIDERSPEMISHGQMTYSAPNAQSHLARTYLSQAFALLRALAMRSPTLESAHTVFVSREELFAAQEAAQWMIGLMLTHHPFGFYQWIARSPVHVREFLLVATWRQILRTSAWCDPSIGSGFSA